MNTDSPVEMLRYALAQVLAMIDCGVTTDVMRKIERESPAASTLHHAREVLRFTKGCK